jgi:ABC-type multidrug transport system fused ATPase/permease subunit
MLVIGIATPFYFAVAAVTLIVYYFLIRYYMMTSVEMKRLEANTRAPLICHIQETINGIYVIRAFDKSSNFINKFFQRQKEYIVAYANQNYANRWISLVTDLFCIVSLATCAYLCIYQRPNPNDPSAQKTNLMGLAITWSLQISAVLSFTLKIMADTESNMNAVIRLLDYIDHNPS